MKLNPLVIALSVGAVLAVNALAADPAGTTEIPTVTRDVLVVTDGEKTETIAAAGRDVTVEGSHNKLTITGQCHALTINGAMNVVSVEAVSSISVVGAENKVTWGKAVDGLKPQITDQGKDNSVSQKKTG